MDFFTPSSRLFGTSNAPSAGYAPVPSAPAYVAPPQYQSPYAASSVYSVAPAPIPPVPTPATNGQPQYGFNPATPTIMPGGVMAPSSMIPQMLYPSNYTHLATPSYATPTPIGDDGLQVRCVHCKAFYYRAQNGPNACQHHSGQFKEPPSWQGTSAGALSLGAMLKKWTCCGDIDLKSTGCCKGYHKEDLETTKILNKFAAAADGEARGAQIAAQLYPSLCQPSGQQLQDSPTLMQSPHINPKKLERNDKEVEEEKDLLARGYIKHIVKTTDTLQGISLRYNAPIDEIKKVNKIFSASQLITRKHIYVKLNRDVRELPPEPEMSEEQQRRRTISSFLTAAPQAVAEEARAYLEGNHWDLKAALEEYASDRKWEDESQRRLL